ncbi:Phage integrase family protein [Nocardioides terrae]|uniref:Phage integrase family protein n=1 Tax=Nocardioides terrae TaxID=574651 RepID=A0A1I1NS12_9ACTN|nr:tyrosine-type recombinase/integrase [Nocardioides terrae]SFC96520.1 Phage integrase family protein [Nocardioides terrae]
MTGDHSFDVRVYKPYVYKGKRGNTYRVRWKVGDQPWARTFSKSAQADAFRSELMSAARRGEPFHPATGEPASWLRGRLQSLSWYDFACQYVDMKWKNASAKYRQDIARALVAATPPLIVGAPPASDREMRSAMNLWGFNAKRRDDAPAEVAERLRWLSTNTRPLSDLLLPGVARKVLDAATSRLDGVRAAPDTVRKHRMLLANAMDYAIELGLLDSNPIRAVKWRTLTASTTTREVDRRSVVNHRQARVLLNAVGEQKPSGPRLVAFFGLMYYSALRPEEAVSITRDDINLPPIDEPEGWGELHLTAASPYAGRHWTDDGSLRETRALKHRLEGDYRSVPIPPPLVPLLRSHLTNFPPRADGRIFYGVNADLLPSKTYMKAWRAARKSALTPQVEMTALARRPYDLRHAAVSTWLNAGVPAPQVAEWAGHGVDVLLKVYAKCIEGQEAVAKQRISAALAES